VPRRPRRWFALESATVLFWSSRFLLFCLRRLALFWLASGVGLSLFSYWFIGVAPMRGENLLFFAPPQRKAGKRKRAHSASL
jgi:hypothetical protein